MTVLNKHKIIIPLIYILGAFVENISSYRCYGPTDVYELLNIGRKRLVFAETKMNRLSSR